MCVRNPPPLHAQPDRTGGGSEEKQMMHMPSFFGTGTISAHHRKKNHKGWGKRAGYATATTERRAWFGRVVAAVRSPSSTKRAS
jgi:ribosomal protein L19E